MDKKIVLSVHQLVDFILRKGDIDSRVFNMQTMQEGTRIHLRYQSIQDGSYESEVALETDIEYDNFSFLLQGRADGIIKTNKKIIIDEIKSTNDELEHFYSSQGEWHLGQAICYAYMYAKMYSCEEIGVRLTYISQIDNSKMIKDFTFPFLSLEQKVYSYIEEYLSFYRLIDKHIESRNISSNELTFPFNEFRKGQREVAKYVYKVASDGGVFFFEAPTGTGKTMSTMFPSMKTFFVNDKIFYLSAKNQGKQVAHEAMKILSKNGLDAYSIVLSSRENMCQLEKSECNPEQCEFARNYYDKINKVIKEVLLKEKNINRDIILHYTLLYGICPFEAQLDISTYCDVIICDYNYLFDPLVYLKRFFDDDKTNYFSLIDEAHNLSERTKDMYTICIEKSKIVCLQKFVKPFKVAKLKRCLKKIIIDLEDFDLDEEYKIYENDFPMKFYNDLDLLFSSMQEVLKENNEINSDEFLDVFKMINRFLKIHEYLDKYFITYIEKKDNNIKAYIRLLDSSELINATLHKLRGAILFSATLTPIDYYIHTLGGDESTPYLKLDSPFDQHNLCLLVRDDISTRYKDRDKSYQQIAESIKTVISQKVGNYLVFFSSYQYLNEVLKCYNVDKENLIVQDKEMKVNDKENFLSSFKENPSFTTVGFAVLGGVFSEGIDLVNDRLIGAIIVGVGLPMVSFERDLIKKYYDEKGVSGFDYAYTNPGKNKVMQAAGRVIRSSTDKGVVLLIDERFMQYKYRDLFKLEWSHYQRVNSCEGIKNHLKLFWNKN